ncbi:hypothetical protein PGT21_001145 [Puccinia graminis f. sp. tritici]|uniref:Uncharacterized protein n=1 Tax=Puccinia graminis f. sp. tritici TaxID=56615 RepID=A0A5B0NTD0_PUCGR|nr:hypothetical protein PGT21_001145 [Puccinia graminis f. sp. tritici]
MYPSKRKETLPMDEVHVPRPSGRKPFRWTRYMYSSSGRKVFRWTRYMYLVQSRNGKAFLLDRGSMYRRSKRNGNPLPCLDEVTIVPRSIAEGKAVPLEDVIVVETTPTRENLEAWQGILDIYS